MSKKEEKDPVERMYTRQDHFFSKVVPFIQKLALRMPDLFPDEVPLLLQRKEGVISLTREQVACLLANAFFCTFSRIEVPAELR